jgi:hypothetical protein
MQTSGDQRREIANVYSALRVESENSSVVPANAGTHSHRPKLFCKVVVTFVFSNKNCRGVWVPAFAGATVVVDDGAVLLR